MNHSKSLKILTEGNQQLSEEQLLFNKLIAQIKKKKKELSKWKKCIVDHKQKSIEYLFPLAEELYTCKKKIVFLLDSRFKDTHFTNSERKKLKSFIPDMCLNLLEEKYDEEIEKILDKYHKKTKQSKSILEYFFEEFKSNIEEEMNQFNGEYIESDKHAYKEPEESSSEKLGRESIREIYRKLAISLHPDKEINEVEKKRKTEVMQRVTKAYKEKNLTELLAIELEEIKLLTNATNLSKIKVEGMNEVLKKELDQLRDKVYLSKRYFQVMFHGIKISALSQKRISKLFDQELNYLKQTMIEAKKDLDCFTKKPKSIKSFLKSIEVKRYKTLEDVLFEY